MNTNKGRILAVLAIILIAGAAYLVGAGMNLTPHTAAAAPVLYSPDTVTGIYDSASPAVVEIKVTQQGTGVYGRSVQQGQGSGFLIDGQGNIITNNHVVSGAATVQVVLKSGATVDGKVVGTDTVDDLAVVNVSPSSVSGITPLTLGDSSAVKPGQIAIALGSPYGLNSTITVGVVSGINRSLGSGGMTGMLQTDASINPGNSGGPLLDAQGQVIGINTAVEAASGSRGIGFAVPSNTATRALPSLLAGKQVTRPWLGISGMALTPSLASSVGLSVNQGIYVVTVLPNSPAEKAALKGAGTGSSGTPAAGGDVITAVDGRAVGSVEDLSTYLNTKQVGNTVNLSILRNGQSLTITVTLGQWPDQVSPNVAPQPSLRPNVPRGGGRFRQGD